MSCNCKYNKFEIMNDKALLVEFRQYFIRRLLYDFQTDRRKKEYNQALFFYNGYKDEYTQSWSETTAEMIDDKFMQAVDDFAKRYCDEHKRNFFEEGINTAKWKDECKARQLIFGKEECDGQSKT